MGAGPDATTRGVRKEESETARGAKRREKREREERERENFFHSSPTYKMREVHDRQGLGSGGEGLPLRHQSSAPLPSPSRHSCSFEPSRQSSSYSFGRRESLMKLQRLRWRVCDFNFIKRLGGGKDSVVHLAEHRSTGMQFAIKQYRKSHLTPFTLRQVRNEIALHSGLFHPAITAFYGSFEDERGDIYLMVEYAPNGDAFTLLHGGRGGGPCDLAGDGRTVSNRFASVAKVQRLRGEIDICQRVITPLASALSHLHENNIVHGDIKPENLMMHNEEGATCKLADFGFAADVTREDDVPRLSTRMGTLEYMAPEVLACDARVRREHISRRGGRPLPPCLILIRLYIRST